MLGPDRALITSSARRGVLHILPPPAFPCMMPSPVLEPPKNVLRTVTGMWWSVAESRRTKPPIKPPHLSHSTGWDNVVRSQVVKYCVMVRTKCAVMLEEMAMENAAEVYRPAERGGLCVCGKCGCRFVDRGVPFDVTVCLHDFRTETSSEIVVTLPSVDSNMTPVILKVAKELGAASRNVVLRGPGKKVIRARDTPTSLFLTTQCTLHAHVSTRRRRRRR